MFICNKGNPAHNKGYDVHAPNVARRIAKPLPASINKNE